ncbi:uncharacterized protein METZ01_LOCUS493180, partial [marine metagenome]
MTENVAWRLGGTNAAWVLRLFSGHRHAVDAHGR